MSLDAGSVFATLGGRFVPAAFDQFDGAMKRSMTQAKGMEGALASSAAKGEAAFARIGKAAKVAAVGGIAAAGLVVDESVKKFNNFQQSMELVHTQAGATQQEVDSLKNKVLDLAKALPQGPEELSKGLFHLESIGLRGSKAMDALKIAAQGAAVGNANLEDTTTALGSAWLVGIKGAGNLRNVMGLLNATVGAGNVRMGDLVQALGTGVLPAAKQAGLSIKDVFGAMAVFTDEGYQASSAAAQFSTALHFLYNPTTKAASAMESIGLKSTSLAADMHKPNGLLVALRDLKSHLDSTFPPSGGHALTVDQQTAALNRFKQGLEASGVSGKKLSDAVDGYKGKLKDMGTAEIAQEQMLGQILPGGRGRIILTLLNQLDRYQMKLKTIGDGVANFGEDVRRTQETDAFKIKTAWSTIEVEMIKLGSHVAPFVATEFSKIAGVIDHLDKNGTFDHIFSTVGHDIQALGGLLPTVELGLHLIGSAAGFTAHEVSGLINAFGGIGVVAPAVLGAYGAIKAFQIGVYLLAPVVRNLAFAFSLLRDAAVGGELAALPGLLLEAIGPAGLLTIGIGVLGGAIALLATRESYETAIAKEEAQAKRDQADAAQKLQSAEDATANSVLSAQQAHLNLAQARQHLTDVTKQYGVHSQQYREALLNEKQAGLSWVEAHKQMLDNQKKLDNQQKTSSIPNATDYGKALTRLKDAQKALNDSRKTGGGQDDPVLLKRVAEAQKEVADTGDRIASANSRAAISSLNVQRQMSGLEPISKRNQAAVAQFVNALNLVPKSKRAKLELDNQDAMAKIGQLIPKLIAYGQIEKTAKLLADSGNAQQALARIQALLNSLPQTKTITITTYDRTVQQLVGSNRPPGSGGPPAHHAKGSKTSGPEVAMIGEDGTEYVIPVDAPYRGRGIELWMQAGRDLGIPGFKKGKAPKKKAAQHRYIPPAIYGVALDETPFTNDLQSAQSKLRGAESAEKSLEHDAALKGKDASTAKKRAKAVHDLPDARKHVTELKALVQRRQKELRDAKTYEARVQKWTDIANIADKAMQHADALDDQKGYDTAKAGRLGALGKLKDLYTDALGHVRKDTSFYRAIQLALGDVTDDIDTTNAAVNQPNTTAAAATELTPDQQNQLDAINAAIALDAVNTPNDLGDDIADTTKLAGFWQDVLSQLQSAGAPSTFIADAATNLKSARDQIDQLTAPVSSSSGGTGIDADAQAQIDQANQRAQIAEDSERITAAALQAYGGAGDISYGRPQINVYTLHPGDPSTLDAIGKAATAGLGYQGAVISPRVVTGI